MRARTFAAIGCLVLGVADVLYLNLAALPPLVAGEADSALASAAEDAHPIEPAIVAGRPQAPAAKTVVNPEIASRPSAVEVPTSVLPGRLAAAPEAAAAPPPPDVPAAAQPEPSAPEEPAQEPVDPAPPDPAPETSNPGDRPRTVAPDGRSTFILFSRNRADLGGASRARLERVASRLAAQPMLHAVVDGHADTRGEPAYNDELSRRRAHRVAEFLAAAGVARERLHVRAFGEARPLSTVQDENPQRRNRRVEVRISASAPPEAIP